LYLAKAGYIDASKRGVWSLTEKGKNAAINDGMTQSIFEEAVDVIRASRDQTNDHNPTELHSDEFEDIEEEIDEELEHRGETLERLKVLSPYGFERFCRALLLETGFEDVEMTGQSGDKGIDGNGTLRINPFVTIKVMYQCKRYKDSVSSPQIRDFRGAITGRADRGLFITTGKFTQDAEIEANRDGVTPIEMVDGSALVKLMEDFEFGLQHVRTFRLESAFFTRFEE
jgi:restriction system protein